MIKIEHLAHFVWKIEPQASSFKTRFIQLPVDTVDRRQYGTCDLYLVMLSW